MKASNPDLPSQISVDLIDRYLAGVATPAESEQVRLWLSGMPDGDARLDSLRLPNGIVDHPSWDLDRGWGDVLKQIDSPAARQKLSEPLAYTASVSSKNPLMTRWYALSMGLALAIAFAIGLGKSPGFSSGSQLPNSISTYTTPTGQRASITLPDGSYVMLNAGSSLEVPVDFNRKQRKLELRGEAFFSVKHHGGAPFTVIAGDNEARVLGTRFVVRNFDTDSAMLVAVEDGKVEVSSSVLTANQEILIDRSGRQVLQSASPSRFSFERGILSFDGIALEDAIQDLNRWFDADVRLGDPGLAERRIEGDYGHGTAGNLAEILELTFDIRVVKDGRTLTLYPRG